MRRSLPPFRLRSIRSDQLAAHRIVGDRRCGETEVIVLAAPQFAQVEILRRIVRGGQLERTARTVERCCCHRGVELRSFYDVTAHCLEADIEQLCRIPALHRKDIRRNFVGPLERFDEGLIFRIVEIADIMQHGLDSVTRGTSLSLDAVGEKSGTPERYSEFCRGIVLDEFECSTTREEDIDAIGLERCDFRKRRLELDIRERNRDILQYFALTGGKRLLEAADHFLAGSIFPGNGHSLPMPGLDHAVACRATDLAIGEGGSEHIFGAHGAGAVSYTHL